MNPARPRFSVLLLPGAGTGSPAARAAIASSLASVCAQTRTSWELIVLGGDGIEPEDAAADPRVRSLRTPPGGDPATGQNPTLAAALDRALGQLLVVLDAGDTLEPDALAQVAREFEAHPETDCVYTDEDVPSEAAAGSQREAIRKPDWSPERLRHGNYVGRLCAMRTALVRDVGGYRADGSPDGTALEYDLTLRVTERARRVGHVAHVAYHRAVRPARPGRAEIEASARAAQRQLDRLGIAATVRPGAVPGYHRMIRKLDPDIGVSIVIPTRGTSTTVWGEPRCMAVEAVRSALAKTAHPNVEIVVVHDEVTPPEVLDELREIAGSRLVLIGYDKPFNFSEKVNLGVLHSGGEVVVLLNDDTEAKSENWLETLVAPLAEPDVGATGARLLFEDGTLQSGGHSYAQSADRPRPREAYRGWPGDHPGDLASLAITRESSGVTGACVALRREVYLRAGGLSEELPVNFNDVDLSLKLRHLGMRVLWVADCEVYHFESRSRERAAPAFERETLIARWGGFTRDPYLSWRFGTSPLPSAGELRKVARRGSRQS